MNVMRLAYFSAVSFNRMSVLYKRLEGEGEWGGGGSGGFTLHMRQRYNTESCVSVYIRVHPGDVRWEDRGNQAI